MADRRRVHRAIGGTGVHEHVPALAVTAAALQVGGQRLADVDGNRQPVAPAALADHDQLTGTPIDVLKGQGRDLAGAQQSQPRHHRQDRVVASADPRAAIAAGQQPRQLSGRQRPRRLGPTRGDRGHCGRQRQRRVPAQIQEPQQCPQAGDQVAKRPHPAGRRLLEHERADVRGCQPPQPKRVVRERAAAGEERPGHAPVALDGSGGQAAITEQVLLVLRHKAIGRRQRRRRRHERRDSQPAQTRQQRRQRALRAPVNMPARTPVDQVLRDPRRRQFPRVEPALLQPAADMRHQLQLRFHGEAAVSQPSQLPSEPVRERCQRTRHAHTPVLPITRSPRQITRSDEQTTPRPAPGYAEPIR